MSAPGFPWVAERAASGRPSLNSLTLPPSLTPLVFEPGYLGFFFYFLKTFNLFFVVVQFFATPMDYSTPGAILCRSPSPKVCSNSCPLSWWCHPTVSSSVTPFSSCPQSFPASGLVTGHASLHVGSLFPDQGLNPCLLLWKHAGPPGKPPGCLVFASRPSWLSFLLLYVCHWPTVYEALHISWFVWKALFHQMLWITAECGWIMLQRSVFLEWMCMNLCSLW